MTESADSSTQIEMPEFGVCVWIDDTACPIGVDLVCDRRTVVKLTGDIATRVAKLMAIPILASELMESLMSPAPADESVAEHVPSVIDRLVHMADEDEGDDLAGDDRRAFAAAYLCLMDTLSEYRAMAAEDPGSEESDEARLVTAETFARFIAHRRAIGPVFDHKTWAPWVLGVREIDHALLHRPDGTIKAYSSWRDYAEAFPGVPAFALTFRAVGDAEYREMSSLERAGFKMFDHAGLAVGDPEYDPDSALPYEHMESAIVFPSRKKRHRGKDVTPPTMRLSYSPEEVDLIVEMVDLRLCDRVVRSGEEAMMIFPLDPRCLRAYTPGSALQ